SMFFLKSSVRPGRGRILLRHKVKEENSHRIDVGCYGSEVLLEQLRCHIRQRSGNLRVTELSLYFLPQTKINEDNTPVRLVHDIGSLDVSVQKPLTMDHGQGLTQTGANQSGMNWV